MIVYGDPSYQEALATLLARLKSRLESLTYRSHDAPLDALRTLLIQAGQLEQAAEDGLPGALPQEAQRWLERLRAATDHAAAAFCAGWAASAGKLSRASEVRRALERMARSLEGTEAAPDVRLTVKIPEGFAFYALYPEQYCVSTRRWKKDHPGLSAAPGVVVGIRSIGTTLSAVVAALLAAEGGSVRRLTVRPTGHPFSRQVEISAGDVTGAAWAIIVDEGPGQSGSSMAAAAEALARAGAAPERISFLPSHDGGPGSASSDGARGWWSRTPCYATLLSELRWDGRSLPEALADRSAVLFGSGEPIEPAEDVGGGMWRRAAYPDAGDWPAVCAPFERTKYRCAARSGGSVLWAFAGLAGVDGSGESAAERSFARLAERAGAGWTVAPSGAALGFVAAPWVEGTPLTRRDASAAVLAHVGHYLAHAAGPPLSPAEQEEALGRLCEMLYWNTWEVIGEETAERTHPWGMRAADLSRGLPAFTYGDGRPAPHEWLRAPSGRLLKFDCSGHETDHTAVGRQPLIWDVGGAMVEWGLEPSAAAPMLAAVREVIGIDYLRSLLDFYRMAYAAFRMGQCALCAGMSTHDPEEQARLQQAAAGYRYQLVRLLSVEP